MNRTSRRQRVDSDNDDMNDDRDPELSTKKARAQPHSASSSSIGVDDEDDETRGMMNEITENRKILSAILRGVDITEIYSPERMVKACANQNLKPGS